MDFKEKRTMSFQGLRLIMILGVVCLHTYMRPVFGAGEELVSFFFVISGFLYKDKLHWKQFVLHKAQQIYPFYWVILALTVTISIIRGQESLDYNLIWHILLLQSWIPKESLIFAFSYVGAAWFLSSLWFCYLLAPLLYKLIAIFPQKAKIVIFLFCFGLICICRNCQNEYKYGVWFAYASPIFRFFEYAMGMAIRHFFRKAPYLNLPKKAEFMSVLVLIIYSRIIGGATSIAHVGMIVYLYCFDSKFFQFVFANRFVMYLASFSLSIYLTHQSLTLSILRPHVHNNVVLIICCFVIGLCFANGYSWVTKSIKK